MWAVILFIFIIAFYNLSFKSLNTKITNIFIKKMMPVECTAPQLFKCSYGWKILSKRPNLLKKRTHYHNIYQYKSESREIVEQYFCWFISSKKWVTMTLQVWTESPYQKYQKKGGL